MIRNVLIIILGVVTVGPTTALGAWIWYAYKRRRTRRAICRRRMT